MNAPKRHHKVPQFYLRGFANEKGQLRVIRADGSGSFINSIERVAAENGYYRLDQIEGDPNAMEKALAEMEAETALVFEKLRSGSWPLDPQDRVTLAYFISIQLARVDGTRDMVGAAMKDVVSILVQMSGGRPRAGQDLDGLIAEFAKYSHVEFLSKAGDLAKYIYMRSWMMATFEDLPLITNDNPVYLTPSTEFYNGEGEDYRGLQIAEHILFPISRYSVLIMRRLDLVLNEPDAEGVVQGKYDRITSEAGIRLSSNASTACGARDFILTHPEDFEDFTPIDFVNPLI